MCPVSRPRDRRRPGRRPLATLTQNTPPMPEAVPRSMLTARLGMSAWRLPIARRVWICWWGGAVRRPGGAVVRRRRQDGHEPGGHRAGMGRREHHRIEHCCGFPAGLWGGAGGASGPCRPEFGCAQGWSPKRCRCRRSPRCIGQVRRWQTVSPRIGHHRPRSAHTRLPPTDRLAESRASAYTTRRPRWRPRACRSWPVARVGRNSRPGARAAVPEPQQRRGHVIIRGEAGHV